MTIRQKFGNALEAGLAALVLAVISLSGGCSEPMYFDYVNKVRGDIRKMYVVDDKGQVVCDLSNNLLKSESDEVSIFGAPENEWKHLGYKELGLNPNKKYTLVTEDKKGNTTREPFEDNAR